jgi:hypothetical protein
MHPCATQYVTKIHNEEAGKVTANLLIANKLSDTMNSKPPSAAHRASRASAAFDATLLRHHPNACAAMVARHTTYATTGALSAPGIDGQSHDRTATTTTA